MARKTYRYSKPSQMLCTECECNIKRGQPVVYVSGPNRPIHATCERLYDLRVPAEARA